MPIVDLEQAKAHLKIPMSDLSTDVVLQGYIDGILEPIEEHVREAIVPREVTEDLDLRGLPRFWLTARPVISLTSLTSLDGTVSYDPAHLVVRGSGMVLVKFGPNPIGMCTAVTQAGYESTPANYVNGALVILQYLWEARRNAGQSSGNSAAAGYSPQIRAEQDAPVGVHWRVADVEKLHRHYRPKITLEDAVTHAVREAQR